jgi:hypothetical protein
MAPRKGKSYQPRLESSFGLTRLQTSVWLEFNSIWLEFDFEFGQIEKAELFVASLTLKSFDFTLKVWLSEGQLNTGQICAKPRFHVGFVKDLRFDLGKTQSLRSLTKVRLSKRSNLKVQYHGKAYLTKRLLGLVCISYQVLGYRCKIGRRIREKNIFVSRPSNG